MQIALTQFWRSNWFLAAAFSAVFALCALGPLKAGFAALEAGFLDRTLAWAGDVPGHDIAIIAIDRPSIENIGPWPWDRNILAEVVDKLSTAGARRIAITLRMDSPQNQLGLFHLENAMKKVGSGAAATYLQQAISELDTDSRLASSMRNAGNVYLPLDFPRDGSATGSNTYDQATVAWHNDSEPTDAPRASHVQGPIDALGAEAAGLGHTYMPADADGVSRRLNQLVLSQGRLYPALALSLVLPAQEESHPRAELSGSNQLKVDGMSMPVDDTLSVLIRWYADRAGSAAFAMDSFWDVFAGNTPPDKYRDKIVLIGGTDPRISRTVSTPLGPETPEVTALAHSISTLANHHFTVRPPWLAYAEPAIYGMIALYLAFLVTLPNWRVAALISGGIALILLACSLALLLTQGIWIKLQGPVWFLLLGHGLMAFKRLQLLQRLRAGAPTDEQESDRMLGLAFQEQGQLDLALEKFNRLPLDDSMMEILYRLALDCERKRKFDRAGQIYSHMAEYDADYRDIQQRMQLSQRLEDTMTLGAPGVSGRVPVKLERDGTRKPSLGRYVVDKELGKGAMGVVYLATDPSLNRVVALKAIPLAEEFDEEDLGGIKERFFREAETAGKLNHPGIVAVYDAGEDNDVAFIAMEYVEGERLGDYSGPTQLLPPRQVMELVARTADALHYAHKHGVVHRDIKPSNLLYNKQQDRLKITDFGVARLTDSKRTRTGLVLGTPSYMSPEQIEGEIVTGRSDLFSLGVTLYQLLTGFLPFRADSLAKLMFKIANEPHQPIRLIREELPECVEIILGKALAKQPADRFENGAEMALALRDCMGKMPD